MKALLDLIKSFKFRDVIIWLKGYFLIWITPLSFWRLTLGRPIKEKLRQGFFYSILSGTIIFIFFYAGNDEVGVVKVLLGQLFSFSTVVIPTLIVSGFLLKRYRTVAPWLESTTAFAIFYFLLVFPIDLILTYLFLEFEEVNFLRLHNYLSGPIAFIYIFFISSAVFYKHKVIVIFASLANFLLVNLLLYIYFGLLISSETSIKKRALENLDPIQKEYVIDRMPFINIQTIPSRFFSYRNKHTGENVIRYEFVALNNSQSASELEKSEVFIDKSESATSTNIQSYLDSLNTLSHLLDSLKGKSKFVMNKKVLESESNFYRRTATLLMSPIDTSNQNINYTFYIAVNKISKEIDTIRTFLIINETRSFLSTYMKEKNEYEQEFRKAFSVPKQVMKYLHFSISP